MDETATFRIWPMVGRRCWKVSPNSLEHAFRLVLSFITVPRMNTRCGQKFQVARKQLQDYNCFVRSNFCFQPTGDRHRLLRSRVQSIKYRVFECTGLVKITIFFLFFFFFPGSRLDRLGHGRPELGASLQLNKTFLDVHKRLKDWIQDRGRFLRVFVV